MQYEGYVHPGFTSVAAEFMRHIRDDGKSGSALSVYHHGHSVIDIWAGKRDASAAPWTEDTLALSFSTTKGVVSTLMHILVDRGVLEYDQPVCHYWPEFGANGKGGISIRHLLTHQAGLYNIRDLIGDAMQMTDWEYMTSRLAQATPSHKAGVEHGYHGLTYGWLLGETMSRASGKSFAQLLQSELVDPLGLEGMYVGLPEQEMHRRAILTAYPKRSVEASESGRVRRKPSMQKRIRGQMITTGLQVLGLDARDLANGLAPRGMSRFSFNDERVVKSCIPAANGMFTARSLAKMYAAIAEGGELQGVRLMTPFRVRELSRIHSRKIDKVVPIPMHWRLGYHRVFTHGPRTPHAFGHFGWGGSGAWADPSRGLSMGFTVNSSGAATSPFGDTRLAFINSAIIRAAEHVDGRRGPFHNTLIERFYDLVN
ncbi:serine hydrolase domain-containing protein [Ketobacter sp.]